ncbi:fimbrillin family protein [uncultured Bacteroides sp.]|uniref:fimbrillin family protein n=1 Tax=uncultured Bacteroides sp. TaxID=162156 RepID=UPI0025EAB63B|nr:fimbrillin family protein [uncultured Bacteroides sp.]
MKKILLVALAAAAMVGCSQNEEIDNAAQKAKIKLGAIVSTTTKAVVTDNSNFETFTVTGYVTDAKIDASSVLGEAFIPATKIDKSGSAWTTTELNYYWPYEKQVQFFATSPALDLVTPAAGYPTFDYTIKATSSEQEDLVVAAKTDQTKVIAGENGVLLPFVHALTQVNFSIKGADAYTYKVSSITIAGVKNKGTYSFENGKWSALTVDGEAPIYSYPLIENASVTGVTAIPVGATNGELMLMPQEMPATGGVVTVKYQVFDDSLPISEEFTATADLAGTKDWVPATKVRYTIALDNKGSKIVLGIPTVDGWTDATENLPKK